MMNIHSLRQSPLTFRLTIAACAVLAMSDALAESKSKTKAQVRERVAPAAQTQTPAAPAAAADPKPLDESIEAGIDFLLKEQQDGGGWGQGGGWRQNGTRDGGRVEGKEVEDPADLGNTCVGLMALLRAGSSPAAGTHKGTATQAFEFICRQVEKSDETSLYVTSVRDTQLQTKIGQYVDTFLAGWTLSELKGRVPDDLEKRRSAALDKVVAKIEKNQKENGAFDGNAGWASVLSQGLCSKALNGAARSGAKVSPAALAKDQRQNEEGLDLSTGTFSAPTTAEPSSAGVDLYRQAAKLGGLWEKNMTNVKGRQKAEAIVADAKAPEPAKAQARVDIERFTKEDKSAQVATQAVAANLGSAKFVAGFGNNGGEEFLSYLTLAEALQAKGGKEWEDWKSKASLTIRTAQNADGGWSGHHCITGRTFCTGTALLVLTVGRDPGAGVAKAAVPPEAKVEETVKAEAIPAIAPEVPASTPAPVPAQEPKQEPAVAPIPPAAPTPSASAGPLPSEPVTRR
jgi:hypothetical protein